MASETQNKVSPRPFTRLKNDPSIFSSTPPALTPIRHKPSISSLFCSTFAHSSSAASSSSTSSSKKMSFKSPTFRGLGCASAAEVSAPESVVRSSADWLEERARRKKEKKGRKKKHNEGKNAAMTPDRPCVTNRSINDLEEEMYDEDSPYTFEMHRAESDLHSARHPRHFRRYYRSPSGLTEVMMFQTNFVLRGSEPYDEYRDLRLNVDNMSYEELLELGDKIGYVSTGLREEEILCCLKKMNPSGLDWKCSICQEEYGTNDEVWKLKCGHGYHLYCIKQWLLQKSACPVCKFAAAA